MSSKISSSTSLVFLERATQCTSVIHQTQVSSSIYS